MVSATFQLSILVACALFVHVYCLAEWGGPNRPFSDDGSRKRRLLEQSNLVSEDMEGDYYQSKSTIMVGRRRLGTNRRKTRDITEQDFESTNNDDGTLNSPKDEASSSMAIKLVNRVKMWPPWPLSLLGRNQEDADEKSQDQDGVVTASNTFPSAAALFWAYFIQRSRIGVRQMQEVGSSLWFHLPPAAPPLMLLASLPRKVITENVETGVELTRRVLPLVSNPFARSLALSGLGLAVMSWAHMEVHRKRNLTPLPLALPHQSVSRVFLPPVLPEEVPEPEIEALQTAEKADEEEESESTTLDDNTAMSMISPKLRKHMAGLYEIAPRPRTFQTMFSEWKRVRRARQRESAKIRRLAIFDELVALQAIKRNSARVRRSRSQSIESSSDVDNEPGYALVTGASQGIGRAIAVELARWEIPLLLVARDLDRLIALAYDLEACYGVKCCVLQADLSQVDAAEKIHATTQKAGITVDILVNNAGIAYEGLSVDMETSDVERMVMINSMSYAKLSQLYGRDMREQRRGRILMVSSMAGLTSSSPNTALYGATKAFGKSLAFSMAKEMEPYGVGVTCLMPGPVLNTQFRDRSGTGRALCWYLPGYPRPARSVAHLGVMSLLDGDTQAIPGWQNRVFVKLFLPILPQRVESMLVQAAWSPLQLPRFGRRRTDEVDNLNQKRKTKESKKGKLVDQSPPPGIHLDLKPRYNMQLPPRLLKLPELEPPQVTAEPTRPETAALDQNEPTPVETTEEEDEDSSDEEPKVKEVVESPAVPFIPAEASDRAESQDLQKEKAIALSKPIAPSSALTETHKCGDPTSQDLEDGQRLLKKELQDTEERNNPMCVGTKSEHERKSQRLWHERDRNDLSPRLGPVDIMEHRDYALQKLEVPMRPKWTIQT